MLKSVVRFGENFMSLTISMTSSRLSPGAGGGEAMREVHIVT